MNSLVDEQSAAGAPALPLPDLRTSALFLDVDGTLLEIASRPDGVVVPADLPDLLARLSRACDGALALVTGREIAVVDGFFSPHCYAVAGVHGSEMRLPDGRRADTPPSPDLPRITATLEAFAANHEGVLVEKKGRAVAIHFRLKPEVEAEVVQLVREALAGAEGLEVQPGKMVVEVRPSRADKGVAIDAFMEDAPFAGRTPLFIGDDWTDESAFAAVNKAGGRSIRVGVAERETQARGLLQSPAAVLNWLRHLVAAAPAA